MHAVLQKRFWANGRSILIVRISRLPGSLAASSLKRRVCWSQTGVSKEGTTLISRAFPLEFSRVIGERSLATTVKLGALSPTLISGPTRVSEFPLKVMTPLLSWAMIVPPVFSRFVRGGSEKKYRALAERLKSIFNIPPGKNAVKETSGPCGPGSSGGTGQGENPGLCVSGFCRGFGRNSEVKGGKGSSSCGETAGTRNLEDRIRIGKEKSIYK